MNRKIIIVALVASVIFFTLLAITLKKDNKEKWEYISDLEIRLDTLIYNYFQNTLNHGSNNIQKVIYQDGWIVDYKNTKIIESHSNYLLTTNIHIAYILKEEENYFPTFHINARELEWLSEFYSIANTNYDVAETAGTYPRHFRVRIIPVLKSFLTNDRIQIKYFTNIRE